MVFLHTAVGKLSIWDSHHDGTVAFDHNVYSREAMTSIQLIYLVTLNCFTIHILKIAVKFLQTTLQFLKILHIFFIEFILFSKNMKIKCEYFNGLLSQNFGLLIPKRQRTATA